MIRISSGDVPRASSFSGLYADDDEWCLEPSEYRAFTESVTGIPLTEDLAAADCYRIGNRLEAFVAERQREGEWTDTLLEAYPDVESREEVVAVARFLRTCHERCLDTATSRN